MWRTNSDGSQIKMKDVATINLGVETYNMFPRLNKKTAAIIALYQAPGSNAVELADQVIANMEEIKDDFPESITYDVSLDSTLPITAGIKDIVVTLDHRPDFGSTGGIYLYSGLEGYTYTYFSDSCILDWSLYVFPYARFYHQCTLLVRIGIGHWNRGR